MKRIYVVLALLLIVSGVALWRRYFRTVILGEAYVGEVQATVWSGTAQVRQPVRTLNYGDRVEITAQQGAWDGVRTPDGAEGWIETRWLLSADLWQKAMALESAAHQMPIQALGHTRTISNLHVEPGRDVPRIRQLMKAVPAILLERRITEVSAPPTQPEQQESADASPETKKEDWWLVRALVKDRGEITGWLLGRFVALDLPSPLPDYISAAGVRAVAWFVVSQVRDSSGQLKPQYLVAATRGPEGQPCDFTMLRVFTWGAKRQRYETAFVESHLCGFLPISVTPAPRPGGDASFQFNASAPGASVEQIRKYAMHQTVVRRLRK